MNFILCFLLFVLTITISQSQMMGGWTNQDTNSTANSALAKVTQFLLANMSTNPQALKQEQWSLNAVLSYQTQVVAGTNHKVVLQIKSSSGNKKVVFAVIFEALGQGDLSISRLFDIVSSSQNNFQNITDQNILIDLKTKIVRVHEYNSQGKIKFNIRKIRWAVVFTTENNQENYYFNYELEGTNNELSLWEHWFRKVENKNALDASLYLVKLPIGKFLFQGFTSGQDCETIPSYLICGVNDCSNEKFLTEGKCLNIEINS